MRGVVVSGLVALAVLTGCSEQAKGPTPLVADTGPIPSPGVVDASPWTIASPFPWNTPSPLVPLAPSQASGLLVLPWSLVGVRAGGRVLRIRYAAGGGCVRPVGVQVIESSTRVLIAPRSRAFDSPGSGACTAELRLAFAEIALRSPLGHRSLVHAALSPGWTQGQAH